MLILGNQIDFQWQNKTFSLLQISSRDIEIFNCIIIGQNSVNTESPDEDRNKNTWYDPFLNENLKKTIKIKLKSIVYKILKDEFKNLYKQEKIKNFKKENQVGVKIVQKNANNEITY